MLTPGRTSSVSSAEGCIQSVLMEENERRACIDFDMSGEYVIAANVTSLPRDSIPLRQPEDSDGKFLISWAFRKRSGMVDEFSQVIARAMQADLLNHWFYEDLTHPQTCIGMSIGD